MDPDPILSTTVLSTRSWNSFKPVVAEEVVKVIKEASNASCDLDPIPTKLFKSCLLDILLPAITQIINMSLETGTFPQTYKCAQVKPLLKKISLDPECLKNYRPVSNLNFISKLIEKVVANQLINHLQQHDLLEPFQSAYKPSHSTETALLRVSNDILRAIDEKKCVLLTLLDLSAAFDTIDHSILLNTLRGNLMIDGTVLQWFSSYLVDRSQCISIAGVKSEKQKLLHGVPQGSVLGPLLFCAYMSELGQIIRRHNLFFHAYADDTQIYISCNVRDTQAATSRLENCIEEIRSWMITHKLKLNDDKTEFLTISSPHNSKELNSIKIKIGSATILSSQNARNLGVVIDSVFNLNNHITSICQSSYFHLRNISAIRRYLDSNTAAQVIHAFVTSRLDYCNSLLFGLPDKSLLRLKKIQNTAIRIITLCNRRDNITPHLKALHWLPVHLRIEFKILLLTFKALNGLAPDYLRDLLKFRTPSSYKLRNDSKSLLVVPRTRTSSYGDRAFSVAAPVLWNSLPVELRDIEELSVFKKNLKTYLFEKF